MKLKLNKKSVKSLSKNAKTLPAAQTPQVGGASPANTHGNICWFFSEAAAVGCFTE